MRSRPRSRGPTSPAACAPSCAPRAWRSPAVWSACTSPPGRAPRRSARCSTAPRSPRRCTPALLPRQPILHHLHRTRRPMPDTILAQSVPGTGAVVPQSKAAADAEGPAFAHEEVGLLAPLYPLPRLELVEGQGARVKDAGGREYLDFTSGIAVNAFGHAPRGLAEALLAQMSRLGHCSNLFANSPALALARELVEATGYERVFFCNSGTEGLDAALKFGRARARGLGLPGRGILAFEGGFHGRTGFALSATFNPSYREPFEPLNPGVRFAPYNDVNGLNA